MMDEQTDVQRMAIALANAEPVKTKIPAYNAFILCGLLQLALKHPAVLPGTPSHHVAVLIIEDLKKVFRGIDPYLAELIQQSKNPENYISILEAGGIQNIGKFF
jgi:hypothetical protein